MITGYLKIFLTVLLLMPLSSQAGNPKKIRAKKHENKTEWLQKLKDYKHAYMIKELDLTDNQQADFFRIYDSKESERFAAERNVREIEKKLIKKGDAATDADYDAAIAAQYKLNDEIARIETKYSKEMRKVLTPRQLFKLRFAERDFQRKLMEKRHDCPPPPKN